MIIKNINKKIVNFLFVISLLFALVNMFSGTKINNIYLKNFIFSQDDKRIDLEVYTTSSYGYISNKKEVDKNEKKYVTFYLNSFYNTPLRTKSRFFINLDDKTNEIYFYDNKDFKLVLKKDEKTKEWIMVE